MYCLQNPEKKSGIPVSIGKMIKYYEMLQHPVLRSHLPETHWMTNSRTLRMLKTYSTVFIKPDKGSGGSGIIRVRKWNKGYEVRRGLSRQVVGSDSVLKAIQSYRKAKSRYLVQRGLQLAKYNGSIFDIRIYMQKPVSEWMISGMAARVAAPKKFVTNFLKGGHPEPLHDVLLTVFAKNRTRVTASLSQMTKLSTIIAETVNKRHPIRELGIDFAIEQNGRLWIIEANSNPGHRLFTQLPDKTMFNTIMRNKSLIRN